MADPTPDSPAAEDDIARKARLQLATGMFCVAASGLLTLVTWLLAWVLAKLGVSSREQLSDAS